MNTQVVRQHVPQQFGAYNPLQSDPTPSSRRVPDRFAPLPYRNIRNPSSSSLLAPPHRAYPVQSYDCEQSTLSASGILANQGFGEHMLRRKTPNGTLAAGYDGTPVQWASKAPAQKHVLLPISGGSSSSKGFIDSAGSGWNYSQSTYMGDCEQRAGDPSMENRISFPPNPNNSHNFLDHSPMHQAGTYYPFNGTQIPTVLQPTYQAGPGPTVSNDAGLYGPYWPNGNFIPYRPAAFRDQGGRPSSHGFDLHTGSQGLFQPNMNGADLTRRELPFMPTDNSTRSYSNGFVTQHPHPSNGVMFSGDSLGPALHSSTNRTSNAQFKEKTLSWAHGIYVDLLAFIHQNKKEHRNSGVPHGSKQYSRNSIYPKPPRQAASEFSVHLGGLHSSNDNFDARSGDGVPGAGIGNPSEPQSLSQNSDFRSSYGLSDQGNMTYTRYPAQELSHYAQNYTFSPQSTASPTSRARDALNLLTDLCEQSNWSWIDGMLLGGCLAYGLEEHPKALQWYSKIIDLDSKHVEAISNLAATLLRLNRREEAEQYWLQSVKLRPSYFEAVEHLISLLCEDHRGKEAVNIIEYVERSLRLPAQDEPRDKYSENMGNTGRNLYAYASNTSERHGSDYAYEGDGYNFDTPLSLNHQYGENSMQAGFGSSGFAIPGADNGRILALVHAKGNMLYALGEISEASKAFEDAVVISVGRGLGGIHGLIRRIINSLSLECFPGGLDPSGLASMASPPLLLPPEKALQTARLVFAKHGDLPGLRHVPAGLAQKAAIHTTSNSLLSLAKIFQDAMSNSTSQRISRMPSGVGDILALYYLSLSLQPSPSTANNVGILLASVQQPPMHRPVVSSDSSKLSALPGVAAGSGIALALAYYNYGLNLDQTHAHLYANLGSLLKDIGQLGAAIKMYEQAVACDGSFDIALANLANAVKDLGRTREAIEYYKRAVAASPDFAEAVCGLSNALNSVCDWRGRGGVILDGGKRDRWHVDDTGMISEARLSGNGGGLMKRVVDIVARQLKDGSTWGRGTLQGHTLHSVLRQIEAAECGGTWSLERRENIQSTLSSWSGHRWEGARIVRLVERATKLATRRWYNDLYVKGKNLPASCYPRPQLPGGLSVPSAPTVLPFHTFTCPLSAKDIRMISQRNALRISCSTLRAPWMQGNVFPPPAPPQPHLNIGYVSSDFNNHPLAHLMQSVFGFHDPSRTKAFCYATTVSDGSIHRQQIENEAPVFRDVSSWPPEKLVQQIVHDGIHILVNLNGYTRGARNEVFAARPAPIQMSFMGFAGTLGAEWCDYVLADETAIPPDTLRPWRRNLDLEDLFEDEQSAEVDNWVYSENIIFCRDTFFCCDHAQSELRGRQLSWEEEQSRRWQMRKELFPSLSDDAIILGNFNQLYKIEPTTFRTWLRILDKVPKAILWLLRFPDLGESNLKRTAREWAGENVASRIWFTDVAPKHQHISRARVCDLFLDTPECNAHTTAADILWSSTPLLTLPRYKYKMCFRMAASILKGALPRNEEGRRAATELIAKDDEQYEEFAIRLALGFRYEVHSGYGEGKGRLGELRRLLYESRWTCALFDTKRWVADLELAYEEAWHRWVANQGGDIYI